MKCFIHSSGFPGEWLWSFVVFFFSKAKINFFEEQEVCGIFGDFLLEKVEEKEIIPSYQQ